MKIVFLDIDGVLNSEAWLLKRDEFHRRADHQAANHGDGERCACYRVEYMVDPEAIARLDRLLVETSAKIVVSSSWRKLVDVPTIERVLRQNGLSSSTEFIGETPDAWDNDVRDNMKLEYGLDGDHMFRGHEIDYWLRYRGGDKLVTTNDIESFIILDDGSDMAMHKNRLVQTDPSFGLLDEDVELAIRMMSWDGKHIP